MPKKSGGSKSKRVSLKQKYKVIKKVQEHLKKKRKAARGTKAPKIKDPGLPSQWPFKEDLVKEFAFKRAQIMAEEQRKKDERKAARQAKDAMVVDEPAMDLMQMARLQNSASLKLADFDTKKRARLTEDFTSDKDNSRKAFYKEFKKVVESADVVIQVLDARDPLACRAPDVERYIRSTNPNKKIILLLNKMDLVPREVGERWLKYFREELPTVAFKCSTQAQSTNISQRRMPKAKVAVAEQDALKGSACLGADTLIQLIKNYTRNANIKTAITVGIVGLPNVGKSSVINSLKRAKVAQVGNTPGVTKGVQEIHLDKSIRLLDSPGVVFSSASDDASAVLRNCVKVEKLEDPTLPVAEILRRVPAKELMALYKIESFDSADRFLQLVAAVRGKLQRGGTPNMVAAARIVLMDWNDGRIPYYTTPPTRSTEFNSSAIVATYAKEFDADEVFANEASAVIAHLPSLEDGGGEGRAFFATESAGEAGVDIGAMEAEAQEAEAARSARERANDAEEEEADEEMVMAASVALQRKRDMAAAGQNATLYGEEGQYNPHAARALKKKRRKGGGEEEEEEVKAVKGSKKSAAKAAKKPSYDDGSEDFDFDEPAAGEDNEGGPAEAGEGMAE
ncbi:MAG: hypothetical protein WDW36_007318 [Sanguina aurantia]